MRRCVCRTGYCFVGLVAVVVVGCGEKKASQPIQNVRPAVADKTNSNGQSTVSDVKPPQMAAVDKAEEPAALTVTLDEIAADTSKFVQQRVEFTAKVAVHGHDSFIHGQLAVVLTGDGTKMAILEGAPYVTVLFAKDDKNGVILRTLQPRQEVTVSGELRLATEKVWEIHRATLVKIGPETAVATTAAALTQAFIDDEEAGRKFNQLPLRITGKVAGNPFEYGAYAAVMITGFPNSQGATTGVVALFRPEHFYIPGSLPLNEADVVKVLPYKDGSDIDVYGILQLTSFGTGKDGQPSLSFEAYPATWPIK